MMKIDEVQIAAAEDEWRKFIISRMAMLQIENILKFIDCQNLPVITADMKLKGNTGGREELKSKMWDHEQALKTPQSLVEHIKVELKRTLIRLEWGWGFGFFPEQKNVDLLRSSNVKCVMLGLCNINRSFVASECPSAPSEDDLFCIGGQK